MEGEYIIQRSRITGEENMSPYSSREMLLKIILYSGYWAGLVELKNKTIYMTKNQKITLLCALDFYQKCFISDQFFAAIECFNPPDPLGEKS